MKEFVFFFFDTNERRFIAKRQKPTHINSRQGGKYRARGLEKESPTNKKIARRNKFPLNNQIVPSTHNVLSSPNSIKRMQNILPHEGIWTYKGWVGKLSAY
jgi:hypothetical protein